MAHTTHPTMHLHLSTLLLIHSAIHPPPSAHPPQVWHMPTYCADTTQSRRHKISILNSVASSRRSKNYGELGNSLWPILLAWQHRPRRRRRSGCSRQRAQPESPRPGCVSNGGVLEPMWLLPRAGGRWGNQGHQPGSTLSLIEPGEPKEPQGVWGKMAVAKKGSIDSYCIDRASHPPVRHRRTAKPPDWSQEAGPVTVVSMWPAALSRAGLPPEHNLTHSRSS